MTMNKTEWTERTNKIGWTDVPVTVNRLLTIFNGNGTGWISKPTDESKMEELTKMTEGDIKSGMTWLNARSKEYAFSFKNARGYSRSVQYVILNVPYTRYQRYGGNYRGITSTIRLNQFNCDLDVKQWQAVVDEHWDKRNTIKNDEDLRQQMNAYHQLERRVEQAEDDAKKVLSPDEIRQGALKTFASYRCGCSGSSHGAWSFGLNYSTRYIVSNADSWQHRESGYKDGDLITPDWTALSKEKSADTSITDDTIRQGLPELAIRYTRAHQTLWQASSNWHNIMNDIYNKMKEMIE